MIGACIYVRICAHHLLYYRPVASLKGFRQCKIVRVDQKNARRCGRRQTHPLFRRKCSDFTTAEVQVRRKPIAAEPQRL